MALEFSKFQPPGGIRAAGSDCPREISVRIAEAKKEIVQRARELFQENRNNIEEEQALDSAMCTLHVFRSTLKNNGKGSAAKEPKAA